MSNEYQSSKEDVATVLKYLMKVAPEYATPENAVKLLEQEKIRIETLEQLHPEMIEEMLSDLESK